MVQEISRKTFFQLGAGIAAAVATAGPVLAERKASPRPRSGDKTLIRNVDVLTMQADHSELSGMDVMLAGGKIAAIAKAIPRGDAEVVDGTGRILMPGLTDGVRSNWMTLETGRLVDTNQGSQAFFAYTKKMAEVMTPEDRYVSDYVGGVQALNSGFTAMINFGRGGSFEQVEQAVAGFKASGIAGVYCHAISEAARADLPSDADYKLAERLRDRHFTADGEVGFGLAMPLNWGPSNAEFKTFYERSRALKPRLLNMFHHNYGGGTGNMSKAAAALPPGRMGSVSDMRDQGILGPDMQLVHATELTDEELKFLAAAGVTFSSAVLSEYRYPIGLTSIFARAQVAGAPACLGVDVPLSESPDPFAMVRAAFALLFRTPENRTIAGTLGSDDTLSWITRDAAKCARMGDQAGTVTVGKRADVILLDTDRIGFPAVGTLADRVAGFGLLSDIDSVWVAGGARKRNGKMVGIDMAALKAKALAQQHRVWVAAGSPVFGIRG